MRPRQCFGVPATFDRSVEAFRHFISIAENAFSLPPINPRVERVVSANMQRSKQGV